LRPDVYYGQSLAALGHAAHEAGHALQDATGYPLLGLRNGLVPLASLGSYTAWLLILAGSTLVGVQSLWGELVLRLGMGAFSVTVLCQLIHLPVEFDASTRAGRLLVRAGMITVVEDPVVQRVLQAAALTYVAAPLTALWTLLYCCISARLLEKSHSQ
jgi:Zn-dependent membrane protease YugP